MTFPPAQTFDSTKFGNSFAPEISVDGRYITYSSFATDLVAGVTVNPSANAQTYLYDRLTGVTTLISSANGDVAANGDNEWGSSVSGGGIFDAFSSTTTNIGGPSLVFTNAQAQASGGATKLVGLSVSDANAAENLTFTLTATDGSFSSAAAAGAAPIAGLNVATFSGNTVTLQGSLAAINAALQTGVIYNPATGAHTLTITVTDSLGGIASQNITVSAPGTVQGPTAGTASIILSDTSHGTGGIVLDDLTPSVLTTSGLMPFTGDGSSVKAVALAGDWGTLTPVILPNTNPALGEVSWTYQINESLAATLNAGATHQDTFAVQLTGAGGTTTEDVTVTVVGSKESPTVAWGATTPGLAVGLASPQALPVDQNYLSGIATAMVNSVQTLNTTKFTYTPAGLTTATFQLSGSNLTYDTNGKLNGGTITQIDVFDSFNNKLLTETGFSIAATDFMNAVNSHNVSSLGSIFNPINPISEVGSTGPDTIVAGSGNDILIGGGGGDTLIGGAGKDILVAGPGGDGLSLGNQSVNVTVTTTAPSGTPANPTGVFGVPIALKIDPSFVAALQADASLALTIFGIPNDATIGIGGATFSPVNGRVTLSQAQLANISSLTVTATQADLGTFALNLAGTTNEGGMFTGGTGADTFVLGGHDGAETITNFSNAKGDVINLANIGSLQSVSDVLSARDAAWL